MTFAPGTHFAAVVGADYAMTLVCYGPERFCRAHLADYVKAHPLAEGDRAEVLAVVPGTSVGTLHDRLLDSIEEYAAAKPASADMVPVYELGTEEPTNYVEVAKQTETPDQKHERDAAIATAVAETYLYGQAVMGTLQWARKFQVALDREGWRVVKK